MISFLYDEILSTLRNEKILNYLTSVNPLRMDYGDVVVLLYGSENYINGIGFNYDEHNHFPYDVFYYS